MLHPDLSTLAAEKPADSVSSLTGTGSRRTDSRSLFGSAREVEIEHEGRIYRLRRTQSNKLILTA